MRFLKIENVLRLERVKLKNHATGTPNLSEQKTKSLPHAKKHFSATSRGI